MAASVDTLLDRILGSLLPPRCVLCNGRGQRPCLDLCADCQGELPVLACACLGCGLPRTTSPEGDPPDASEPLRDGTACPACRQHPPPYDRCFAACSYAHPVDAMVQALKYGDQLAVGRVLGEVLARGVEAFGLHLDVDCLLPVPLHPRRLAERGYNQSAEISRHAARRLGRPVEPRLARRVGETRPQVGLPLLDRRANVEGAFRAERASVVGRRVVVVDDVVTTGSTVAELARELRRAGAVSVDVWCVARALD